jgi:hypothetical protein
MILRILIIFSNFDTSIFASNFGQASQVRFTCGNFTSCRLFYKMWQNLSYDNEPDRQSLQNIIKKHYICSYNMYMFSNIIYSYYGCLVHCWNWYRVFSSSEIYNLHFFYTGGAYLKQGPVWKKHRLDMYTVF